jgi:hypothetical protein
MGGNLSFQKLENLFLASRGIRDEKGNLIGVVVAMINLNLDTCLQLKEAKRSLFHLSIIRACCVSLSRDKHYVVSATGSSSTPSMKMFSKEKRSPKRFMLLEEKNRLSA